MALPRSASAVRSLDSHPPRCTNTCLPIPIVQVLPIYDIHETIPKSSRAGDKHCPQFTHTVLLLSSVAKTHFTALHRRLGEESRKALQFLILACCLFLAKNIDCTPIRDGMCAGRRCRLNCSWPSLVQTFSSPDSRLLLRIRGILGGDSSHRAAKPTTVLTSC